MTALNRLSRAALRAKIDRAERDYSQALKAVPLSYYSTPLREIMAFDSPWAIELKRTHEIARILSDERAYRLKYHGSERPYQAA